MIHDLKIAYGIRVNVSSGARGLTFGLSLLLLPFFVYARSEGSGETVV